MPSFVPSVRRPLSIVTDNTGTHLLVEDGLGLTTVTRLLTVVTTLSLRSQRILALLVLGNLVGAGRSRSFIRSHVGQCSDVRYLRVLPALLTLAVCRTI